jgi:hypothetical protein
MRLSNVNFFLVCGLGLAGCFGILTPRQNFIDHINGRIGRDVSSIESYEFGYKDNLIETKQLLNGNYENKYIGRSHLGDCIYVFEIDSKTNKILSWRIEGNPNGCIVNP